MSAPRPLSQPRFEALLYRRTPWAPLISRELEWWTNEDESLIATVSLDLVDHDYSWIILGRDETGVFRGTELNTCLSSLEDAREEQNKRIAELSIGNPQEFPQWDNDKKKHEILIPCVPESKLHPIFNYLLTSEGYSPARGIIKELSYAFVDLDGNYKKDFQTTGFEGRLWELYLYAFFYERKFLIDDGHAVPDFIVENPFGRLGVEAVTVNATAGVEAPKPHTPKEEAELCKDYMPIKWGGPLNGKLKKRYWEKEQIKGLPLILAIHDFHGDGSMVWSLPALSDYLYGVRCDDKGQDHRVENHTCGAKVIPSGFFSLPDSENISAVIASNEATLTKFNRMGKIADFGAPNIIMERSGALLDLEKMVGVPFTRSTEIGVPNEVWASGLWVFHNPEAKRPVDIEVFPTSLNVFLIDGQREYRSAQKQHVIRSRTFVGFPR